MTQYTSFVAVEERTVVEGGKPKTIAVPVEMPEGVSYEGVFGESDAACPPPPAGNFMGGGSFRRAEACYKTRSYAGGQASGSLAPGPLSIVDERPLLAAQKEGRGTSTSRNIELNSGSSMKYKDLSKLDKSLVAVMASYSQGVRNGKVAGIEIKNGNINVRILVSKISPAIVANLTKLGLQNAQPNKQALVVTGVIAIEKLEKLVDLAEVLFVRGVN